MQQQFKYQNAFKATVWQKEIHSSDTVVMSHHAWVRETDIMAIMTHTVGKDGGGEHVFLGTQISGKEKISCFTTVFTYFCLLFLWQVYVALAGLEFMMYPRIHK